MFFNFWIISAYFRRSWFCSRRLSDFEREAKIQSDFCTTLFLYDFSQLKSLKRFRQKNHAYCAWRPEL
ncbi:hypothetical protein D927_02596 [Enterococcus faecalis 02-MB-BW-10]|nr:hypothetical protein D927_02596 [Enterococcus faecalis 02-MB-BW-10]PQF71986.1 hypothetical protein CUS69_00405 [Enterococcus faecalis]